MNHTEYDSDDQIADDHPKLVDSIRQLDKRPRYEKIFRGYTSFFL